MALHSCCGYMDSQLNLCYTKKTGLAVYDDYERLMAKYNRMLMDRDAWRVAVWKYTKG